MHIRSSKLFFPYSLVNRNLTRAIFLIFFIITAPPYITGCKTTSEYHYEADKIAQAIIQEKQKTLLGEDGEFQMERPSNILRRRLLLEQDLQYSGKASLGKDQLEPVSHWPEDEHFLSSDSLNEDSPPLKPGVPLKISLVEAIQIGAQNSSEYQTLKETIFKKALDLDLKKNDFGLTPGGSLESSYTLDKSSRNNNLPDNNILEGFEHEGSLNLSKTLFNGITISTGLAIDLVKLLTLGKFTSTGIVGDLSVSIPLLRGSGRHIVSEPLIQAERDVIYAMYEFEQYKKTYAVQIAQSYLTVLRQQNQVENALENYQNLSLFARRTRMLANAGRATEIEVDRAVQEELKSRSRWITANTAFEKQLDTFKNLVGLPPDAILELESKELSFLNERILKYLSSDKEASTSLKTDLQLASDLSMEQTSDQANGGPLELDENQAIRLGFDNRLDLRIKEGEVYDSQRQVVVKADALGAELTLFGKAELGSSRTLQSASADNARLSTGRGIYTGLFNLDLPLERTAERNDYRISLIDLDKAIRDLQNTEDSIKLSIRDSLRRMSQAREGLSIQSNALRLAEKRVKSTEMFMEAGRAELTDLLDAQEALLTARNDLTSALVDYRIAELEFQRDTGLLKINKDGLMVEYESGGRENGKQE